MKKHSLKDFDPERIAQTETQMWQAYYAHDFFRLFRLTLAIFREQFGARGVALLRLAFFATKAAMVFRKTGDETRTKSYLKKYYAVLAACSAESFDVQVAANSEYDWWLIHRSPKRGSLERALAENMAVLYSVPVAKLSQYGVYKAQAMELRRNATHRDKVEPDWSRIQTTLSKAYAVLHDAVA